LASAATAEGAAFLKKKVVATVKVWRGSAKCGNGNRIGIQKKSFQTLPQTTAASQRLVPLSAPKRCADGKHSARLVGLGSQSFTMKKSFQTFQTFQSTVTAFLGL
jgi:hypothetical protein